VVYKNKKQSKMKILTSNPVITTKRVDDTEFFNSDGDTGFRPYAPGYTPEAPKTIAPFTPEYAASQKKSGKVWNKAKGVWADAKDLGLIDKGKDFIKNWTGKGNKAEPQAVAEPSKDDNKMSTTIKVLIISGVVLALGIAVYAISKKK